MLATHLRVELGLSQPYYTMMNPGSIRHALTIDFIVK